MKTKEQKYREAVARALPNAPRIIAAAKVLGLTVSSLDLKIKLGIRKNDTTYDDQILNASGR